MKNVTIYSTPTCVYCKAAKDYFKANNVAFTEFNVASDLERRKEMIDDMRLAKEKQSLDFYTIAELTTMDENSTIEDRAPAGPAQPDGPGGPGGPPGGGGGMDLGGGLGGPPDLGGGLGGEPGAPGGEAPGGAPGAPPEGMGGGEPPGGGGIPPA